MGRPAPVQPWYVPRTPEERELWDQAKLEIKNFLLVNKEGVNATKILSKDRPVQHAPSTSFLVFTWFVVLSLGTLRLNFAPQEFRLINSICCFSDFLQDQGVHIPCHKFGLTFNQFLFHIQDTIEVRCFCRHFNISSRTKYIFVSFYLPFFALSFFLINFN